MSFAIDLFEQYMNEDSLFKGEKLYDVGAVKSFKWVDKNLISFIIEDNSLFEVELKRTGKKISSISCDCSQTSPSVACAHIVCSLFYFRSKLLSEVQHQNRDSQSGRRSKSISLNRLMENISSDELESFIRSYAKKDKKFALALKVRFLSKLSDDNDSSSYKSILDQIIRPRTTKNFKYSVSEILLFKKTIEEFFDQIQDHLSLEKYQQAFQIIAPCIEKIYYLMEVLQENSLRLDEHRAKATEFIDYIIQSEVSPAFLNEIRIFIHSLIKKSFFQVHSKPCKLLNLLFELTIEETDRMILLETLRERLYLPQNSHLSTLSYALYSYLLERLLKMDKYEWLVNRSIDFNFQLIQELLWRDDFNNAEHLLNLNKESRNVSTQLFTDYFIQLFELKGQKKEVCELALDQFQHSKLDRYFIKAKEQNISQWPLLCIQLEKDLLKLYNTEKDDLIFSFYALEGELEKSAELILENQDFDSFQDHIHKLVHLGESKFLKLSEALLDREIRNHAGGKLNQKVMNVVRKLYAVEAYKINKKLIHHIEEKHPHRLSLLKELSLF